MRLVFFGSGAFGVPTLEALCQQHDVVLAVSQPDKPAGRKKILTPTPVAAWLSEHRPGVRLIKPERVREDATVDDIRATDADAWVVIAYGQKLPDRLLGLDTQDPVFAINLHGSILPRHRGAAPINAAIIAGDDFVGSSVIRVVSEMDAGSVLAQSRSALDPMTTAGELHDELAEDGPGLILEVLERFGRGTLVETEQDESLVTYAGKMTKADGFVDWSKPADEIRRRIHGFNPWPGASTTLGGQLLKLHRAETVEASALGPEFPPAASEASHGHLIDPRTGVVVCGTGAVRLLEVQPPGKSVMSWADFARGRELARGQRLGQPEASA
ncbi:MAG: methionyl-tRNA formyltransferase [Planctomycetota bacterium]